MTPRSFGYLALDGSPQLESGPWIVSIDGAPVGEAGLEHWDYYKPLHIAHRLTSGDVVALERVLTLGEGARLEAVIHWRSDRTGLRGFGKPAVLREGDNHLDLDLHGEDLGGCLQLEAQIVVADPGRGAGPLAPKRPYSRVWSDEHRVWLEGGTPRLAVTTVPFSRTAIADGRCAAWLVDLDSGELHASAAGRLRVLLNEEHPAVAALLDGSAGPADTLLLQFLDYEVHRTVASVALSHPDFDEAEEYPKGSVGQMLQTVLLRLGKGRGQLQVLAQSSMGPVDALVQDAVGLMTGGLQ